MNKVVNKVVRGGSWNTYAHGVRATYRNLSGLSFADAYVGFRLARTKDKDNKK